jgi:hypothetical protein
MDSLTMEDKREQGPAHEQEAGLEQTKTKHNAIHSEVDLVEHDEHVDEVSEDEHKHVDYSSFTKTQFVDLVKELSKDGNHQRNESIIREVKPLYDEIRDKERSSALQRFTQEGGVAEDFDYKGDENDNAFDANVKLIRDRRHQQLRELEEKKGDNLKRKQDLIEKLRQLTDHQDHSNQFESFKEIQREWRSIGPVPGVQAKTLWANYHALVDRFYDTQNIYFELKELDRKKNLEAKLELCNRAEKLVNIEMIKDAIRELNELHHEFKHLGPVPLENKEAVWQRFKTASDAVYAKRDQYLQRLQQDLNANYELKNKLGDEAQAFTSYNTDRIKEWNEKTKEILEIQKRWEAVGGLPRAKAKEVNKKFWAAFKTFFNNKNTFFKKLDEEREANLQLKNDLVKKALDLRESQDWEKTSNDLKNLQQKWKDVGPVPEKFREKVFKEFKDACDYFFSQRRGQQGKVEQDQIDNLNVKTAVIEELERRTSENTATVEVLQGLQDKYNSIGFVPKKDITTIRTRYHDAVQKFVDAIPDLSNDDKSRVILENQLSDLKKDPMGEQKIFQKEMGIRKKIQSVENDISLWKNNLEFFGKSKNAESVREEFNQKIKDATEHLQQLKKQLKMLRTA